MWLAIMTVASAVFALCAVALAVRSNLSPVQVAGCGAATFAMSMTLLFGVAHYLGSGGRDDENPPEEARRPRPDDRPRSRTGRAQTR
uniref:hypothetical protein n=1 Tax=Sphaerisporangium sp. CA-236357 TaxID=3240030 RepID=UPI003F4928E0